MHAPLYSHLVQNHTISHQAIQREAGQALEAGVLPGVVVSPPCGEDRSPAESWSAGTTKFSADERMMVLLALELRPRARRGPWEVSAYCVKAVDGFRRPRSFRVGTSLPFPREGGDSRNEEIILDVTKKPSQRIEVLELSTKLTDCHTVAVCIHSSVNMSEKKYVV